MFEKIYNDTYEFLLLGACDFSFKNLNCKNVVDGLYVPHHDSKMVFGAHANYYSLKGATHMFKETLENFSFFDKHYMNIFDFFKNTSFICFPNLVVTDISTTNLQHKYTLFSRLEESYYLNCFNNDFNFNDYNFIYLILFINAPKLKLKKYKSYQEVMDFLIKSTFNKHSEINEIKKRCVMDFFTIEEICFILHFDIFKS
jgi:hypothetical protein